MLVDRLAAGPELELRLLAPADAEELSALIGHNREYLREWLPWVDSSRTTEDVRTFIDGMRGRHAGEQSFACGMWYRGRIAGTIGVHQIDRANRATSIGYWLARDLQGRGIVTAACRALVDYCFRELRLHRVEIRCATGNTRSCAIPERLGFTREGVLRGAQWVNDRFVDLVVWGLLESEWPTPSVPR